jgi:AraC family transcriptional regulator, regulatory protein of adaptative response / methylated-DNA-[protein]-cysteine methyltransferase
MEDFLGKAKRYLDSRRGERVTLGELARAVGTSPFHLQRRFKQAFGLSPRGYQEAYRVESVKSALRQGSRVADAVFGAGYGSVSRFYEKPALGMQARAYRAQGRGQSIEYCTFASAIGTVLIATTPKGVCSVKIGADAKALEDALAAEFSAAALEQRPLPALRREILAFIEGEASLARVPLDIRGTVFQQRVWDALRAIPRGETRSYGEIAAHIGAPRAVRAVGSACGANPVALLVPCHRAVRSDGALGGYAWGIERKKRLLALERRKRK